MRSRIAEPSRVISVCQSALWAFLVAGFSANWSDVQGQAAKAKGGIAAMRPAAAYPEKDLAKYAEPLPGENSPIGVGRSVALTLSIGKVLNDLEVVEAQLGKGDETLKTLTVLYDDKKVKRTWPAKEIVRLESGDRVFEVVNDPARKGFILFDAARRDADINERLKETRHQLWTEPTDSEQEVTMAEYRKFLDSVREQYPFPMRVHETKFFLFCTDMPQNQIAPYLKDLDKMYADLCTAFGIPAGKNIWRGKGMVIAFTAKESFQAFERVVMKNNDVEGAQGLHHSATDGRAITAVYRGNDPAYFAVVLVHETAHGFLHRLRSNVDIPPWIDEGIADWIAGKVVKSSRSIENRQKEAIQAMQQSGRMGADFFDDTARLTPEQYGIASLLTDFMVKQDPGRYREFILGIKDGLTPEESLQQSYSVAPAVLIHQFGRQYGISNLRP